MQVERARKYTKKYANDYRDYIANASPEQKALWARERKLQDKPELRAEYMKVVNSLLVFLPPSSNNHGGKYGITAPKERDGDAFVEGMKVHLSRRTF